MSNREKKPCQITISRTIQLPSSSIINEMIYDVTDGELQVTFHPQGDDVDGATYLYHDVPEETVKDMIKSKSVGSFFRENIRDKFKTELV